MAEDNTLLNANYIAEVDEEQGNELKLAEFQLSTLVSTLHSRFEQAKNARDVVESHWLDAYQNYRGIYGKNVRFRKNEKSRVFVKITKAKVLAAYGMLVDVIFGTTEFPIGIQPSRVPTGVLDKAHLAPSIETSEPMLGMEEIEEDEEEFQNPFDVGFAGDDKEVLPAGGLLLLQKDQQQTQILLSLTLQKNQLEKCNG